MSIFILRVQLGYATNDPYQFETKRVKLTSCLIFDNFSGFEDCLLHLIVILRRLISEEVVGIRNKPC